MLANRCTYMYGQHSGNSSIRFEDRSLGIILNILFFIFNMFSPYLRFLTERKLKY